MIDRRFERTARWPFLLFALFVVLKLTGYLRFDWWAVTSPLWVVVVFAWGLAVIGLLVGEALGFFHKRGYRKWSRYAKQRGIV